MKKYLVVEHKRYWEQINTDFLYFVIWNIIHGDFDEIFQYLEEWYGIDDYTDTGTKEMVSRDLAMASDIYGFLSVVLESYTFGNRKFEEEEWWFESCGFNNGCLVLIFCNG